MKHLVYAAAEAGIMKLIKTVFRSPAGRIVCGMCQEENSLPEDVAEENGHEKVATYLRGITKRSVGFQVHFNRCPLAQFILFYH